jgi:H+/gluconate symporter-like permease
MTISMTIFLGVISSIIASYFFLLFNTKVKKFNNKILSWYLSRNIKKENTFYADAGRETHHVYHYNLKSSFFKLFLFAVILILVGMCIHQYNLAGLYEQLNSLETHDFQTYKEIVEQHNEKIFERNFNFYKKFGMLNGYILITLTFLIILIGINSNYTYIRYNKIEELITTFKWHLAILAPYLTIKEVNILKSKWALIDSKEDFLKIKNEVATQVKKFIIDQEIDLEE